MAKPDMRRNDLARLSQPYDTPSTANPEALATALDVAVPSWRALDYAILDDLAEGPPFGIAWWTSNPRFGTKRRILISDYLTCTVRSAADNLIEAALHHLELLEFIDRDSDSVANCFAIGPDGVPAVRLPPSLRPMDDIALPLIRAHVIGSLRAIAGALDCVGATIIGVLALPLPIHPANFSKVRHFISKKHKSRSVSGLAAIHVDFADKLHRVLAQSGPSGWLDWALSFRNMVIHRGRRIEMGQIKRRLPILADAGGRPILRMMRVHQLPTDPSRSDVEVMIDGLDQLLLEEPAEETVEGTIRCTTRLVDQLGSILLEVWKRRRAERDLSEQPQRQWPDGPRARSVRFAGYAPGKLPFAPNASVLHPNLLKRLRAASLLDADRGQWATFD